MCERAGPLRRHRAGRARHPDLVDLAPSSAAWPGPSDRRPALCRGRRRRQRAGERWPCRAARSRKRAHADLASSVPNTSTNSSASRSRPSASGPSRPCVDGPLGQRLGDARRPAASSAASANARRSSTSVGGDHPVDQADAQRLVGVDLAAGEDQVLGPGRTDQAGQPLGAAAAGDDPEQDLGLAELGGVADDPEVAGQRQLAAAAEGVAGHRGDGDPRDGGQACRARRGTGGRSARLSPARRTR